MAKQDWSPRGLKTNCIIEMHQEAESDPDVSWLEYLVKEGEQVYIKDGASPAQARRYARRDRKRLEAYRRGEWSMMYVYAIIEFEDRLGKTVKLQSGGLGNVESDASKPYLKDIAKNEAADLERQMALRGYRCGKKQPIRWYF